MNLERGVLTDSLSFSREIYKLYYEKQEGD